MAPFLSYSISNYLVLRVNPLRMLMCSPMVARSAPHVPLEEQLAVSACGRHFAMLISICLNPSPITRTVPLNIKA